MATDLFNITREKVYLIRKLSSRILKSFGYAVKIIK